MKQIRNNVFETNSSSTHSLSIPEKIDETKLTSITPNSEGNIILEGGEFGWEIEEYNDPLTKANYVVVDNLYNEHRLEIIKDIIKEHTGCTDVIILAQNKDWDAPYYSYIDHESSGKTNELFESKEKLRNFIFSPSCILYTDNDNH